MHKHENHSHENSNDKPLFLAIILNIIITVSEIIGGIFSSSLALLSDAFHNFSDVFALMISFIAIKISKKQKDSSKSFGYKRIEILAALLNILTLFAACSYIIYEAVKKIINPHEIKVPIMLIVATLGFLGNIFSVLLLYKGSSRNLNIKSAFLHLIGDTVSSVGVLIAGLIIIIFPKLYIIDPILSIIIAFYIIKESFSIFLESVNILMQGIPKGINAEKIMERLKNEKKLQIIDIHHMHIWSLSPDEIILDCHIVMPKDSFFNINAKLKEINEILSCEFHICHVTIQFETQGFDHTTSCKL